MEKLYYSISEVAGMLGENISLVRFWTNTFDKFVKPRRNAKGDRLYKTDDIEALKQIHHLVKVKGLTLEGAAQQLGAGRSKVDRTVKAIDSLKEIRAQLVEIRKTL